MDCVYCHHKCWRAGRQKNGLQRYYCPTCRKYQQARYQYKAYWGSTDSQIKSLVRSNLYELSTINRPDIRMPLNAKGIGDHRSKPTVTAP
ncbi:hypothetical protein [Puia dinghuensis]|uniref:hypothetical protein n=1 Tax=Puia dinghuensis TaxID=1792502 RepID=UPI001668C3C7|nr:hypothetical protein [Puia dinghuensis]